MKPNPGKVIAAAAGTILFFCAPPPAPGTDAPARAVPAIPAANEWIWLAPFVNNCDIGSVSAWPVDSFQQTILIRRFDDIAMRLLTEFRRCEKYGRYQMVGDRSLASMVVTVTLGTVTPRAGDSITIPIGFRTHSSATGKIHDVYFSFTAALPANETATPFHHAGLIIGEIASLFPYRPIVRSFYVADK